MDKKLQKLLTLLSVSFMIVALCLPGVFRRSSARLQKLAWRITTIGQVSAHNRNSTVYDQHKGAVLIMFDDGWQTQFSHGYQTMTDYGFVGTVAVISGAVGEYNYMGLWELSEMYRAGWDMANHTERHPWLNSLTLEQQKKEMLSCREWLQYHRLTGAENYLIFPGGYYNESTFQVMEEEGFLTARSVDDYWSIVPSVRMDHVTVLPVTPAISVSDIEAMLTKTAAEKSVLILIFHKFSDTPDAWGMSYPPSDFDRICESIAVTDLQVLPISAFY